MRRIAALALFGALLCACDRPVSNATGDSLRIVTLAPHLTELVFAAGAGEYLVGVSAYSDYPPEALEIPIVSDAFTVDQEQLAILAPTLILAWDGGTPTTLIEGLAASGYRVEAIRTHGLDDIPVAIERIGELAGREDPADNVSRWFQRGIAELRDRHSQSSPVTVFYQISSRPLYTVGGTHYISDIIALCGGRNVFDDLGELAPTVSVESVIDRNPEAMLAADAGGDSAFDVWDRFPHLSVNQSGNYFTVDADSIGRPSLRLVDAASAVCEHLDTARRSLSETPASP
ncbi:MAG: cobalamin-binding protein [Woeseiaceae bacterium]|nr:cobalamin-binding protein [Woeseiaceae bacterium]